MAKPRATKRTATKTSSTKKSSSRTATTQSATKQSSSPRRAHEYPGAWTPGQPGEPRWIAVERVIWVDADGTRRPGRIAIAAPEPHPDASSSCMVLVDCREPRARAIYGADHLQAMLLALQLAGTELHTFGDRGGRVLDPEGTDFAVEAYFGPLLRAAK